MTTPPKKKPRRMTAKFIQDVVQRIEKVNEWLAIDQVISLCTYRGFVVPEGFADGYAYAWECLRMNTPWGHTSPSARLRFQRACDWHRLYEDEWYHFALYKKEGVSPEGYRARAIDEQLWDRAEAMDELTDILKEHSDWPYSSMHGKIATAYYSARIRPYTTWGEIPDPYQ